MAATVGISLLSLLATVGIILAAVALVGLFILAVLKVLRGDSIQAARLSQSDEARIIQEIYQGLSNLDRRVEALETILLDRVRKEDTNA